MVSKRVDRILRAAQWAFVTALGLVTVLMAMSVRVPVLVTIGSAAGTFLFPLVRVWLRKDNHQRKEGKTEGNHRHLKLSLLGIGIMVLAGSSSIVTAVADCSYYLIPVMVCYVSYFDFFGMLVPISSCFIEWVAAPYNCTVYTLGGIL